MEKNNKILTLLKNASVAAILGHVVALVILFMISTALAKNEDPSSMMPAGALLSLFIGAAVCGLIAGKKIDGPFGGAVAGLVFSLLLIIVSLVLNVALPADASASEAGYGIGFKIGMLAGATMLSSLIGLWINGRKNSKKSLAKQRKKIAGR